MSNGLLQDAVQGRVHPRARGRDRPPVTRQAAADKALDESQRVGGDSQAHDPAADLDESQLEEAAATDVDSPKRRMGRPPRRERGPEIRSSG